MVVCFFSHRERRQGLDVGDDVEHDRSVRFDRGSGAEIAIRTMEARSRSADWNCDQRLLARARQAMGSTASALLVSAFTQPDLVSRQGNFSA